MRGQRVTIKMVQIIVLSLALVGCMSVDMFSQRNPQWHGKPLKRVMVIGNFTDLVYRSYAEDQMCDYIEDYSDSQCLQSLNYIFAGQSEPAQISEVLTKEKVDGVIYMSTQAQGTTTINKPIVLTTFNWTPGFGTLIGYGGETTTDWANYSVKLYIPSGAMIWYANTDASGKPKDTIEHSSYHIAKDLVSDEIILPGGSKHYKP